jgi:hypothetical protein
MIYIHVTIVGGKECGTPSTGNTGVPEAISACSQGYPLELRASVHADLPRRGALNIADEPSQATGSVHPTATGEFPRRDIQLASSAD